MVNASYLHCLYLSFTYFINYLNKNSVNKETKKTKFFSQANIQSAVTHMDVLLYSVNSSTKHI